MARDIDLSPYVASGPIFESVRNDPAFFRAARVEGGTVAWPNGADIDPDVLYYDGLPPWAGERTITAVERRWQAYAPIKTGKMSESSLLTR
jgi:hypothetical protein